MSKPMDEFALIRYLTKRDDGSSLPLSDQDAPASGVVVGIGDDAAVFSISPGMEIVACCDAMTEGVHFTRRTMSPFDIGYKALASNLSDVAAMGGIPRFLLVALGRSAEWTDEELKEMYQGIFQLADRYGVRMVGGDTVSSLGGTFINITVLGEVERGKALTRAAAKPGDLVFVTGPLGSSAAGLYYLLENGLPEEEGMDPEWAKALMMSHRQPEPQIVAGRIFIQEECVHALNDVSDGLAGEAWEIAEASGVAILLEETSLPILPETALYAGKVGVSALDWVLYGGEDYQLVGTVPSSSFARLQEAMRRADLSLHVIGRVEEGPPGVWLVRSGGVKDPVAKKGYNHFA